jgi:hypothetical protein
VIVNDPAGLNEISDSMGLIKFKTLIMNTYFKYTIKSLLITSCLMLSDTLMAQEADSLKNKETSHQAIIHIYDNQERTQVVVPSVSVDVNHIGDTVSVITIGKRRIEVIENNNQTRVRMTRIPNGDFKGHFAGFDLGMNSLMKSGMSSSFADDERFMEVNLAKSINVGINFLQYSIPLTANNRVGLVTGAGINFSNYRFDNPSVMYRNQVTGKIEGNPVDRDLLEKHKLVTTFINFPLMLETQFSSDHQHKGFLSVGGFFGMKTGSHTKVVYDGKTDKVYGNLNLRPYQYGIAFRGGYEWLKVFANYHLSSLFEDEKGPQVFPFTVGLTLTNF